MAPKDSTRRLGARNKAVAGKRKLMETSGIPHNHGKRVHAPNGAPGESPELGGHNKTRALEEIEPRAQTPEAEITPVAQDSPSPGRRMNLTEIHQRVATVPNLQYTRRKKNGGVLRVNQRAVAKETTRAVLAVVGATMKAVAGSSKVTANFEATPTAAQRPAQAQRIAEAQGVQTQGDAQHMTPPPSPTSGVHITCYLSPGQQIQTVVSRNSSSPQISQPFQSPVGIVIGVPLRSETFREYEPLVRGRSVQNNFENEGGFQNVRPGLAPRCLQEGFSGIAATPPAAPPVISLAPATAPTALPTRSPFLANYPAHAHTPARDPALAYSPYPDISYLLSFLPPAEKQAFLSTHPQARISLADDPIVETNPCFQSPDATTSHYSASTERESQRPSLQQQETEKEPSKKKRAVAVERLMRLEKGPTPPNSTSGASQARTTRPPIAPKPTAVHEAGPSKSRRKHRRTRPLSESSGGSSKPDTPTPQDSPASQKSRQSNESVSLGTWGTTGEIPPFQVNSLAAPIGPFGDHMKKFAFDQAAKEFPWHLNWNQQCPELKSKFTMRLRKAYPGPWEPKTILTAVGGNLRERRCRLKKKFETYKNWKSVPRPNGCSVDSWKKIYESTKDEKKNHKSTICKAAADARMKEVGFSHKLGPGGLKGIIDRFAAEFKREPTEEEIEFAKRHGYVALEERINSGFLTNQDKEVVGALEGDINAVGTLQEKETTTEVGTESGSSDSDNDDNEDVEDDEDNEDDD